MKPILSLPAALLTAALFFISCSKNDNAPAPPATGNTAAFNATMASGAWVVSSFTQRTEDKTSQFNNYVFHFESNGVLTAEKNNSTVTGSWSHTPSITYYGATNKEAIHISMGANSPFDRISKTWNVVSGTSTALKLDNPEVLEDEHLQFTKQ